MSDPQWENLKELFHAALALPPQERSSYLESAAGGNDALRQAVESLLKSHEATDNFIDTPAYQAAAELLVVDNEFKANQTVAHYRIISLLGEGGMGKVYLAEDAKLHRQVALKFLAGSFAQDPDRLERFEREARAASALNHPNILTIHEIGESEGRRFIATEFIEGETLRERLSKGLNTEDALVIAMQIASALVAAHRVGIVHRDIKPENIMVRRDDGLVKVLDFGLAKMSRTSSIEQAKSVDEAPGRFKTGPGMVIGTVAYMSPEQARGDVVDARTDIWSLGVILYEMICGSSPFIAATSNEIISAILSKTPSPRLCCHAQELPASLEEVVARALAKNNDERYQTSQALLIDLKRTQHSLRPDPTVEHNRLTDTAFVTPRVKATDPLIATTRPALSAEDIGKPAMARKHNAIPFASIVDYVKGHERVALAVLAVVIVTATAGLGWYKINREHQQNSRLVAPLATNKIKRFTSDGRSTLAAISPDGKYLVHVLDNGEQQSLQLRQVTTYSDEKQIAAPADVRYGGLTFSTNGDYLYYVATEKNGGATLYQMPALGGVSKKLLVNIDSPVTFSPDGRQFAFFRGYPDQGEDALVVANADGTGERKLATRNRDYWWPAWSPDGKIIASRVTRRESDSYRSVVAVQVDDGTVKPITSKRWSLIGEMVWLRDGSGLVMTASEERSDPMQIWYLSYPGGEAHKITNDLNDYESIGVTADSATLVAIRSESSSNLWDLEHGETSRATQLTFTNLDGFKGISWTPNNHLVYESWASGSSELWTVGTNGNPQQLTADSRHNAGPVVSPDGKYVVFYSDVNGHNHIWRMDIGGSDLRQLTDGPGEQAADISADSQWIVFTSLLDNITVWKVSIDGGKPVQLTNKPSSMPTVSPDGRLIACNYMEDGRWKIAIIPFAGGPPVKTFESFTHPDWLPFHWTPDGRALAYIDQRVPSSIWSVSLSGGPPKQLLDFKSGRVFDFAWSRDGSQLAVARGEATSDVVLINNFVNRQ